MSLKKRVERLEQQNGGDEDRVHICWHQAGEPCDCPPADKIVTWPDDKLEAIVNGPGPDVRNMSDGELERIIDEPKD